MTEYTTCLSDVKKFAERFYDSDVEIFATLAQEWNELAANLAAGEDLVEDDFVMEGNWALSGVRLKVQDVLKIAGRLANDD